MEENIYRFGVDADVTSATEKLEAIVGLMDKIDAINAKSKDNYFHASQKDIDHNVKAMKEVIQLTKAVERQMQSIKGVQMMKGDFGGVEAINKELNNLRNNLDATKNKFTETADSRGSFSKLNQDISKEQARYNKELSKEAKTLREMRDIQRSIQNTKRRVDSRADVYQATGRATYNQGENFKKDIDYLDSVSKQTETFNKQIDSYNKRIEEVDQELRNLAKSTSKNDQERENESTALKQTRKELESLISTIKEVKYQASSAKSVSEGAKVKTKDVKQEAERGTFASVLSERAPSISMAVIGAVGATLGGLYAKGATAKEGMKEPSVHIGQRSGNSNYRAVRKEMQTMGLDSKTNYKGLDMLNFQDAVLSGMGFQGKESLMASTEQLAQGGRAIPVDKDSMTQFLSQTMRDGSVNNSNQIKEMQEAFLGAIEQSGMVGREKEQLEALQNLNAQVFAGRNGSDEELKNVLALQTLFSEKGGASLQGEKGSQVLTSLDAGFKNVGNDTMASLVFGRGTKFQGIEGRWDQAKQLEGGIGNPDNIESLIRFSQNYTGREQTDKETMAIFKESASQYLGAELTTDNVEGIFNSTDGFRNFDKDVLRRISEENLETGSDKFDKNSKDYKKSKEALDDRSQATTERHASNMNDFGDIVKRTNSAMSGLPTIMYAFALAVISATATLGASALMSAGSSKIKGATRTPLTDVTKAGSKKGKVFTGKSSGPAKPGAKGASTSFEGASGASKGLGKGFMSKGIKGNIKSFKSGAKGLGETFSTQGPKGLWNVMKDGAVSGGKNLGKGAKGSVKNVGKMFSGGKGSVGKGLSGIGGAVGKALPWLAVGGTALDIATSEDKVKATGRGVGSIGGGIAGAKGGALAGGAIGSAVPVVGTAIGAGVGALVGGFAGSSVGGSVGDWAVDKGRGVREWFTGESSDERSERKERKKQEKQDYHNQKLKERKERREKRREGRSNSLAGITAEASDFDSSEKLRGSLDGSMYNNSLEPLVQGTAIGAGMGTVTQKENQNRKSEEKDISNKRNTSEKIREVNNMNESSNLSLYGKLLDRATKILAIAKAQNGIFGNGSGGGSGGVRGGGKLNTIGDGKKWTDPNIKNHDLGQTVSGLTAEELDAWIDAKAPPNSPMRGMGALYIEAGEKSGLDPRYLVAHSALETGWGMSNLSGGGDQANGNWFGIGAFDDNPNNGYNYDLGLVGGAEWIADNYYNNGQTTLDSMVNDPGGHNYATDPEWADKIASIMAGSDPYTKSAPQTFNTTNEVNVRVGDSRSAPDAQQVGRSIGETATQGLNSALDFFSKELKRS